MTIENITTLANAVMSIVAIVISIVKGNKAKSSLTAEQINQKADMKKQKYLQKQYKKNNIEVVEDENKTIIL